MTVINSNFRARQSFASSKCIIDVPNLLAIQKESYAAFLQADVDPDQRSNTGLQGVFKSIFPIKDFQETCQLDFVRYRLEQPKYDIEECLSRGVSYESGVTIDVRLTLFDKGEDGKVGIRSVQEQPVYFGTLPCMTPNGTFVYHGCERVTISQLHRSPGAFFDHDDAEGPKGRIIPYNGSWVDFEVDTKGMLQVRLDRKRKLPATILLRALDYTAEDILRMFYEVETVTVAHEGDTVSFYRPFCKLGVDGKPVLDKNGKAAVSDFVKNQRVDYDIENPDTHEMIIKAGSKLNAGKIRKIRDMGYTHIPISVESILHRVSAQDYYNENGEILIECNQPFTQDLLDQLVEAGIEDINTIYFDDDNLNVGRQISNTLALDKKYSLDNYKKFDPKQARLDIYNRMRPGDPPAEDQPDIEFRKLFFDPARYDLSKVGRLKLNRKFANIRFIGEDIEEVERHRNDPDHGYSADLTVLTKRDFIGTCVYLNALAQNKATQKTFGYTLKAQRKTRQDDDSVISEFNAGLLDSEDTKTTALGYRRTIDAKDSSGADITIEEYWERDGQTIELDIAYDDIDHLANRRVRPIGELVENAYRIGLVRMARTTRERMMIMQTNEPLRPHELINAKMVDATIHELFGGGSGSSMTPAQFMDQTNPLSEITHKRRLTALGPGGLTRERAGFEVRDVHPTHYGRICPIETPEGQNIGLISSLAMFARINEYGFIETPYRRVEICEDDNGKERACLTSTVEYVSALDEKSKVICPANVVLEKTKVGGEEREYIVGDANNMIECHVDGELTVMSLHDIDYIDVSPQQMVSLAAALVPFLENDDANRALMGANMQRQAVPLLVSEAPFVATGIEKTIGRDSGAAIFAEHSGTVVRSDATCVIVRPDRDSDDLEVKPDTYHLYKYRRSNQGTSFNQIPAVDVGEHVEKGDVVADGPSTDCGELSLGRNMVVAFVPWCGYNYEDAILLSERMVIDDVFTSIHIEEFECIARDTKLGHEEITNDIPNVSEDALKDLDETGVIRIGATVKPGDILVGKVTPKGETQLSPEEKLLRAIFGEKAEDVRDSSLRVSPGISGTVIDVKILSRKKENYDARTKAIEEEAKEKLNREREIQKSIIRDNGYLRIRDIIMGVKTAAALIDNDKKTLIKKGVKVTEEMLVEVPRNLWKDIQVADKEVAAKIDIIWRNVETALEETDHYYDDKIVKVEKNDELPPLELKRVKVSIAIKRKIQVGDKMAGRHGNKGVVSRVLPVEDMPYLEDGTPVDFVLNPLGVPSRMNIGQLLELHLGWGARGVGRRINELMQTARTDSCRKLRAFLVNAYPSYKELIESLSEDEVIEFSKKCNRGIHVATPVFDGAHEKDIDNLLRQAGLDVSARSTLFDGRTGEPFANDVSVGVMYMLKLHHLVDEKIHARSIGPYSMVTQQPLGGKAQFGGQRLGEMEVWAMMAYGAAYSLQEFLTVKSDDVLGRTRMYESIVKGDFALESGLPESFNVLIKELQSLCLNIELIEDNN